MRTEEYYRGTNGLRGDMRWKLRRGLQTTESDGGEVGNNRDGDAIGMNTAQGSPGGLNAF